MARIVQPQWPQKWPFHITPLHSTFYCPHGYPSPVRWPPWGLKKLNYLPDLFMCRYAAVCLFIDYSRGDLSCIGAAKLLEHVPTSSNCPALWSAQEPTASRPAYGHGSRPTGLSYRPHIAHVEYSHQPAFHALRETRNLWTHACRQRDTLLVDSAPSASDSI